MARITSTHSKFTWRRATPFAVTAAVVGAIVVVLVSAAGNPIAFEPETGTLASGATTTTVTGQSGTGAVKFAAATSPTPTPTSTPSQTTNCAPNPHLCGYPDATNTGVPAGTTLRRVPQDVTSGSGWVWDTRFGGYISVSGNGAVLDGLDVAGGIDITANNVTIRNCKIVSSGESNAIGLRHTQNTTIDYVTISAPPGASGASRLLVGVKDIYGDATGTSITHSNISGWSTGVQTHEGLIADNYIHDPIYNTGDHTNGTTSNGSTVPMTIRHNTIFNQLGQTDAISLFQDFGVEANRVVDNNLVAGGGYTIYGGGGSQASSNIKITNNRFARLYFPNSGSYGPYTAFQAGNTGNVWSGNVWDDTGAPVN